MYENLAWNNFIKTGDIESFLEYKRINEVNDYINNREVRLNESYKNKGNSDKGNNI